MRPLGGARIRASELQLCCLVSARVRAFAIPGSPHISILHTRAQSHCAALLLLGRRSGQWFLFRRFWH